MKQRRLLICPSLPYVFTLAPLVAFRSPILPNRLAVQNAKMYAFGVMWAALMCMGHLNEAERDTVKAAGALASLEKQL